MDQLSKVTDTIRAVSGTAADFLEKIAGPSLEEIGLIAGEHLRFLRWKREARILERAKEFLDEEGIEPKQVNLKVLAPILEYSWLDEEEDMVNKWAALLANAASGKDEDPYFLPSFPRILSELSPREAKLLDELYDYRNKEELLGFGINFEIIGDRIGFELKETRLYVLSLIRFGLLGNPKITSPEGLADGKVSQTQLGEAFIAACTPPGKRKVSAQDV